MEPETPALCSHRVVYGAVTANWYKEDVRLYLEACAEEDPGDVSLIRAALNDIARAQNMSQLAREVGMTREGLYKALGENGNPTFATVMKITRAGDAGAYHCITSLLSTASATSCSREGSPCLRPLVLVSQPLVNHRSGLVTASRCDEIYCLTIQIASALSCLRASHR